MSNKREEMKMKSAAKHALEPKLRFPEFRDAGEWETKRLGQLLLGHPDYGVNAPAVPYSEDLPAYLRITDISEEGYFLRDKKASVAINAIDENYLSEGDIALARTGASVGKSYKYRKEDGKLVFAGFLIRIKPDPKTIDSTFLFNFLSTQQYWKWVGVISARSGQPGLNANEYASLLIHVPPHERELSEQQKIADCLSSIDDLITAQTQKSDTLKAHKQGLMKQLFPAKGETLPKLRFPEFRDAGKWEEYFGNDLFEQINDRNPDPDLPILAITQENGAIPRDTINYHVSVTEKSIESYKVVQVGDFIISLRSFQGGIEYSQYHGICSPAYVILRRLIEGSNVYFKQYLKTERFIRLLTKNLEGLRDGKMISYKQFSNLSVPVPIIDEQQKIADCLSSIDELVTLEAQKLDTLKAHKKGLMQLLFPALDEVQG